MKCRILLLLLLVVAAGCKEPVDREQQARQAATEVVVRSYNHLLAGEYEQVVDCRAGADSMPATYRQQVAMAYKQFMAQQQQAHGGISSFKVSNVQRDSTLGLMQVFLQLTFGDNTQEEIVVPAIEHNGAWRLK